MSGDRGTWGRLGRTQSTDGGNAEKTIRWGACLPPAALGTGEEGGHEVPISHWDTEAAEGRGSQEVAIKPPLEDRGCSSAQLLTAD